MKTQERWKRGRTTVYNIGYHIIWCSKYRRSVLVDGVDDRLKQLLDEKAEEYECEIKAMEVMPDHVHIFIKTVPTLPIHFIIQQLKGYSAHVLRQEFPHLKSRIPNLWTRSYYIESVGNVSKDNIQRYIENQKRS